MRCRLRQIDELIHEDKVLFRGPERGPEIGLGLGRRILYRLDLPGAFPETTS